MIASVTIAAALTIPVPAAIMVAVAMALALAIPVPAAIMVAVAMALALAIPVSTAIMVTVAMALALTIPVSAAIMVAVPMTLTALITVSAAAIIAVPVETAGSVGTRTPVGNLNRRNSADRVVIRYRYLAATIVNLGEQRVDLALRPFEIILDINITADAGQTSQVHQG